MYARYVYALALIFLLLASVPALSVSQGTSSLDISIPPSFPLSATTAQDVNASTFDVKGNITLANYGGAVFVGIPTNAPEGSSLSYFLDAGTWTLFRNNTLVLPVRSGDSQLANLVLATDGLSCNHGQFYGQVTGIELDTATINDGNAAVSMVMYLSSLPQRASYRISITDDSRIKQAIMGEAAANGTPGAIGDPMIEVGGISSGSQGSIGYIIARIKAGDEALHGNVTAYRYNDGTASRLPCQTMISEGDTIYEAISPGPGTFAFVGNFTGVQPARVSLGSVLILSGSLALLLFALEAAIIAAIKMASKS